MKNVNLIFWVKAISLVANFGSTRSASTSVDHKRIKKSNFLTPRPPPPSGLNKLHDITQSNENHLSASCSLLSY